MQCPHIIQQRSHSLVGNSDPTKWGCLIHLDVSSQLLKKKKKEEMPLEKSGDL